MMTATIIKVPERSLLLSPLAQRHAQLSGQNIRASTCFEDFIHGLLWVLIFNYFSALTIYVQ